MASKAACAALNGLLTSGWDRIDRLARRRNGADGRGGRGRRGRKTIEATFDHGDDGYGLWLDPAVQDNANYSEHWAGHREVSVTIEPPSVRSFSARCAIAVSE